VVAIGVDHMYVVARREAGIRASPCQRGLLVASVAMACPPGGGGGWETATAAMQKPLSRSSKTGGGNQPVPHHAERMHKLIALCIGECHM
jgi:hypothetical protein